MTKKGSKTSEIGPDLTVLVVDDDEAMREVLRVRLQKWGYRVESAADVAQAREAASRHDPDLVLSDVVMQGASGLDLLASLQEGDSQRPVVLMTAHGTVDMAVEAMKQGACDFITKPIDYDQLKALIEQLEADSRQHQEARSLSRDLEAAPGLGPMVGASPKMRAVFQLIRKVAKVEASVLVTGESGTGKELVARAVHDLSARREGPFIAINSAAIPSELMESEILGHEKGAFTGASSRREGCFELAKGGTLFLDEVAEMPLALQPKLLRILEDRRVRRLGGKEEFEVDARVVAATNQVPATAVEEGRLREDLYYRLNVFSIELPPLAERGRDVVLLAQHFVNELAATHESQVEGLSEEARETIDNYGWPGNVRELRNVIERAVVLASGRLIEKRHLPVYVTRPGAGRESISLPIGISMDEAEKHLILKTLASAGDNKAEAARRLGVDVKTIRNKLKRYESEK